jgi:hypothetical protein
MNMFNQEPSYLKASDYNTVAELLYNLSAGRYSKPDLSLLEGCNIVAVLPVGTYVLFKIDPNGKDRSVNCYSHGNGSHLNSDKFYQERDVVEVFKFIQQNCACWTEF